jgi:hypothetical protein
MIRTRTGPLDGSSEREAERGGAGQYPGYGSRGTESPVTITRQQKKQRSVLLSLLDSPAIFLLHGSNYDVKQILVLVSFQEIYDGSLALINLSGMLWRHLYRFVRGSAGAGGGWRSYREKHWIGYLNKVDCNLPSQIGNVSPEVAQVTCRPHLAKELEITMIIARPLSR